MKIAIILCTFFALTFAVRPVPVNIREHSEYVQPSRPRYPGGILRPENTDRIINGKNDVKGAHKYQISLQKLGSSWYHTCGASILSSYRILTAAHCVDSGVASSYRAIAGEYELYKNEGTEQTITASKLVVHPDWNEAKINNDVAVVHLSKAIIYGTYAGRVTLASSLPGNGDKSTVTGWGWIKYEGPVRPTILQVLDTTRFEKSTFAWIITTKTPGSFTSLWDSDTQVATRDENQGICMGDSGGPLVKGSAGEQYGICSYVLTPCGQDKPDYYANVPHFKSWIESH